MAEIRLANIEKRYGEQTVLENINIDIADREFMVFVGPSGCGKTTLMRTIAGLEEPTSGQVIIGDQDVTDVPPSKRGVAMVFQSYALYPHMSVRDNITFALKLAKTPQAQIDEAVRTAAEILQIGHLLDRKPAALSGGQRQRVAIGRAIVRDPKVFLFDEPLSNLDAALRVQMRLEIIKLHQRLDATMVYVTHDQIEAMTMADRIAVINQGHLEQLGTPLELYETPRNLFVAGFIGSPKMNFIKTRIDAIDADGVTVTLTGDVRLTVPVDGSSLTSGGEVTLGVRPEHLGVERGVDGAADITLAAEVKVIEHLGGEKLIHAQLGEGLEVEIKASGHAAVEHGERPDLAVRAALCHLFDEQGNALTRLSGNPSEGKVALAG
ncbi:MAG: sn-glycerol-3-phosphate ABC transporter ATP-binding protein UgpC [Acidihalobacter sp.]|uniref:ABC transporter ATP-binding protein n=1 Tax=Acidihalobacter sp. TaxID=1872108 RepID=UPI00307FB230